MIWPDQECHGRPIWGFDNRFEISNGWMVNQKKKKEKRK